MSAASVSASPSPFRTLSKDVLQLIMQQTDSQSLLALARVSRFTYSAAQSDIAWRGHLVRLPAARVQKFVASSLLRFADVFVSWEMSHSSQLVQSEDAVRALVAPPFRLRALRLRVRLNLTSWRWILSAPQTAGLRILDVQVDHSVFRSAELSLIADRMHELRTLMLDASQSWMNCPSNFLEPLREINSITDLRLCMEAGSHSESIGACPALRKLTLKRCRKDDHAQVLADVALQAKLHELTLDHVHAQLPQGWLPVLGLFQQLRVLRLHHCSDIDGFILAIESSPSLAPQLTCLEIGFLADPRTFLQEFLVKRVVVPCRDVLISLLLKRPMITLRLFLQPLAAFLHNATPAESMMLTPEWKRTAASYRSLREKFEGRVVVLTRGMMDE